MEQNQLRNRGREGPAEKDGRTQSHRNVDYTGFGSVNVLNVNII